MKKFYVCILFLISSIVSQAQSKLGFAYDEAGNRIKREIELPITKSLSKGKFLENYGDFLDNLGKHSLVIHPKSTDGKFKICITGLQRSDDCRLYVYSTKGTLLLSSDIHSEEIDVDICNQPQGIYLLQVTINDLSTTWKIIKR